MRLPDVLRWFPGRRVLRSWAFRTGAVKWWWRYRHLIDSKYRQAPPATDLVDPHREQLWSLIAPFNPQSVLEVGCGDGANLALLARKAPHVRLDGVDVNPLALAITRQRIFDGGGMLGTLQPGSADELPVATASVDVALSDAVFMYLPPATAIAALREMRRVATRAIVVHTFSTDTLPTSAVIGGNWVHQLPTLIALAIPAASISHHPSRAGTAPGQWREFGTVCVVTW